MQAVQLGAVHYVFIAMIVLVIVTLIMRKDVVIPCIIGIVAIGMVATGADPIASVGILFNALVLAGKEFWEIIVVIAVVVAMSGALRETKVDNVMLTPVKRVIGNANVAFFVLGIMMLLVSWFIWPSPAVALIGAIMLPVALKAGLPAIWAAVAMNIFGHGMALSSDFVIQGAPGLTAKSAGLEANDVMSAMIPLFIVMSVVTVGVAFFMMRKDLKNHKIELGEVETTVQEGKAPVSSVVLAVLVPAVIVLDIVLMIVFELRGGDATALIGGSALLLTVIIAFTKFKYSDALEKVTDYVRDGFKFGVKIFAPVVVIGGFFFIGGESAPAILGQSTFDTALAGTSGSIITDIGYAMANIVPDVKAPVVVMQAAVGGVTGLDGSGFSGLPLVGSLAEAFAAVSTASKAGLAALGQMMAIWVGGGTIIPWAVIPVAAICGVKPGDLVRKNFVPVIIGIVVTIIVAIFIL